MYSNELLGCTEDEKITKQGSGLKYLWENDVKPHGHCQTEERSQSGYAMVNDEWTVSVRSRRGLLVGLLSRSNPLTVAAPRWVEDAGECCWLNFESSSCTSFTRID